jgi:hypothetical protein
VTKNTLPEGLKARILEAAHKKSSPTRKAVTADTVLILLTALAAALNVFLAAGGTSLGPRPAALVASTLLGRGTIALASSWAAFGRGGSMLGRSLWWLLATILSTPLAIAGWMLLATRTPASDPANDWHCFAAATLIGLVPLLAFAIVHRQSDIARPVATGAALGAAAGAWADFLMVLHCPTAELGHRLLCHVGPSAILVALGAGLGAALICQNVRSDAFVAERSAAHRFTDGS